MSDVTLRKLVKRYGEVEVIHGVDLDIADGEFVVFVGPSGCGKSTLLRMIAGLEETSSGEIRIGESDVTRADPDDNLKPGQAIRVTATKENGTQVLFTAQCRIDTPVEVEYYRNGGILHKVLRDLAAS